MLSHSNRREDTASYFHTQARQVRDEAQRILGIEIPRFECSLRTIFALTEVPASLETKPPETKPKDAKVTFNVQMRLVWPEKLS